MKHRATSTYFKTSRRTPSKDSAALGKSGATAVQARVSFDSAEPWPPPAAVLTALGGRGLWGRQQRWYRLPESCQAQALMIERALIN